MKIQVNAQVQRHQPSRRSRLRHLVNRRDTLVMGIIRAEREGDLDRASIIREEANRVNNLIKMVCNERSDDMN